MGRAPPFGKLKGFMKIEVRVGERHSSQRALEALRKAVSMIDEIESDFQITQLLQVAIKGSDIDFEVSNQFSP